MYAQTKGSSALAPAVERQKVVKKKIRPRRKQNRVIKTIATILVAAGAAVTLLFNYAAMVEMSNDVSRMRGELAALKSENTRKKVEIDASIDLNKIEVEALKLGMRRPERSQTVYICSNEKDYAEVIPGEAPEKGGVLAAVINSISAALSYLN